MATGGKPPNDTGKWLQTGATAPEESCLCLFDCDTFNRASPVDWNIDELSPKNLRPWLGRREFIVSLKAKSLAEPGATERYHQANGNFVRLVTDATRVASRSFDELDAPRMAWVVATYEADYLAADGEARLLGKADPEEHDAADSGWTDVLEQGDKPYIRSLFEDEAVAVARRQGWVFDTKSEAFSNLCLEMLRTAIWANRLRMERDNGRPVPTPLAPEPPPSSQRTSARTVSASFDAVVRAETKRPTFTGGASTKQSWNTSLRYLREAHGELRPEAITRRHATELADLLALAPVKRGVEQSQRGWPLRKLVESYAGKDVQRLSWKARATIMGALQAAWNQCQRSGSINDDLPNPFARPSLGKAPPPRKNDGLTRDESRAIFALPLFTSAERPSGGWGEAAFWLPLLLLTTGARPEELAQALVGDVGEGADRGEWWLRITAEGAHPHKGKRSLKSPSAERAIPLPRLLIDLGFGDYFGWLRRRGEMALFPALRPKGQRRELFARYGAWWSAYLQENGVGLDGKRPAREFRPTWTTIARECGVSREAQEYLMGHAPDSSDMNARYGSRQPLSRQMHKLSFDGWGLEKVRVWQPPSKATPNGESATARSPAMESAAE